MASRKFEKVSAWHKRLASRSKRGWPTDGLFRHHSQGLPRAINDKRSTLQTMNLDDSSRNRVCIPLIMISSCAYSLDNLFGAHTKRLISSHFQFDKFKYLQHYRHMIHVPHLHEPYSPCTVLRNSSLHANTHRKYQTATTTQQPCPKIKST
jgi:hypothetical protein